MASQKMPFSYLVERRPGADRDRVVEHLLEHCLFLRRSSDDLRVDKIACGVDSVVIIPLAATPGRARPAAQLLCQTGRSLRVVTRQLYLPRVLQHRRKVHRRPDRQRSKPEVRLDVAVPAKAVGHAIIPAKPDHWECRRQKRSCSNVLCLFSVCPVFVPSLSW